MISYFAGGETHTNNTNTHILPEAADSDISPQAAPRRAAAPRAAVQRPKPKGMGLMSHCSCGWAEPSLLGGI